MMCLIHTHGARSQYRLLQRWLDIFQLQYRLNEFMRLYADFYFQRFGERRRSCFAWVHRPRIDFLRPPIPPCHAGVLEFS